LDNKVIDIDAHSSTFHFWVRSRRFRRGGHLVAGVGMS